MKIFDYKDRKYDLKTKFTKYYKNLIHLQFQ